MANFLASVIGPGEEVVLEEADVNELAEWFTLHSRLDSKSAFDLVDEVVQMPGIKVVLHRGIYKRYCFKKKIFKAVLAILASAPFFASTFPGSPISWQQITPWLAGLLGVNVAQLLDLFIALFETTTLELSNDEDLVVQNVVSVPQRADNIRQRIKAQFPYFTDRELDNIFARLTSHGFLIDVPDAEGKLMYRLNLKWKKAAPER